MKRICSLFLALLLLLSLAACGEKQDSNPTGSTSQGSSGKLELPEAPDPTPQPDDVPDVPDDSAADPSEPSEEVLPTQPDDVPDDDAQPPMDVDYGGEDAFSYSVTAALALYDLQTYLTREPFAVAYLGYREEGDTAELSAWLHDNVPVLAATMPFVAEIPAQRTFGSYGDLYCIVPRGEDTSLWVHSVAWEDLGNGARPNVGDALYQSDHAEPVLVYVTHGAWRDETDTVIRATTADGEGIEWYPLVDLESGGCTVPVDLDGVPLLFDFSNLYDVGDYLPYLDYDYGPDAGWGAPTDLGLANTTWNSKNGWMLELSYDENALNGSGEAVVYRPAEGGLEQDCRGIWQMQDNCLYLELYDADGKMTTGLFPVLIPPSGEMLYIERDADGALPPFFTPGQPHTTMTLSYG